MFQASLLFHVKHSRSGRFSPRLAQAGKNERQGRRRYPLHSGGLPQSFRPGGFELGLEFVRKPLKPPVIEIVRYPFRLVALQRQSIPILPFEVTCIQSVTRHLLTNFRRMARELRHEVRQGVKVDRREAQEFEGGPRPPSAAISTPD